MRNLTRLPVLLVVLAAAGCSSSTAVLEPEHGRTASLVSQVSLESANQTVLLVSLEDGTVIKQMIDVGAEICFKQATSTATTCLVEGAPIIDALTDTVIGIEMVEQHIDLVGKSRP